MQCAIQKQSDLKPAPFDSSFSRLTKGQTLLLNMIRKHIDENKPITREDIAECYGEAMGTKELMEYEGHYDENGKWQSRFYRAMVDVSKDEHRKKWRSLQWFKLNIGACIMKGKLIVLPVIEI